MAFPEASSMNANTNQIFPEDQTDAAPELEPDDFYFDGPHFVFTEKFLLKMGNCCNSGCRHCPYKTEAEDYSDSPFA
jgi:hypothetical protein